MKLKLYGVRSWVIEARQTRSSIRDRRGRSGLGDEEFWKQVLISIPLAICRIFEIQVRLFSLCNSSIFATIPIVYWLIGLLVFHTVQKKEKDFKSDVICQRRLGLARLAVPTVTINLPLLPLLHSIVPQVVYCPPSLLHSLASPPSVLPCVAYRQPLYCTNLNCVFTPIPSLTLPVQRKRRETVFKLQENWPWFDTLVISGVVD